MCLSFCFCAAGGPHSQLAQIAQDHLETDSIVNGKDASGKGNQKYPSNTEDNRSHTPEKQPKHVQQTTRQ